MGHPVSNAVELGLLKSETVLKSIQSLRTDIFGSVIRAKNMQNSGNGDRSKNTIKYFEFNYAQLWKSLLMSCNFTHLWKPPRILK